MKAIKAIILAILLVMSFGLINADAETAIQQTTYDVTYLPEYSDYTGTKIFYPSSIPTDAEFFPIQIQNQIVPLNSSLMVRISKENYSTMHYTSSFDSSFNVYQLYRSEGLTSDNGETLTFTIDLCYRNENKYIAVTPKMELTVALKDLPYDLTLAQLNPQIELSQNFQDSNLRVVVPSDSSLSGTYTVWVEDKNGTRYFDESSIRFDNNETSYAKMYDPRYDIAFKGCGNAGYYTYPGRVGVIYLQQNRLDTDISRVELGEYDLVLYRNGTEAARFENLIKIVDKPFAFVTYADYYAETVSVGDKYFSVLLNLNGGNPEDYNVVMKSADSNGTVATGTGKYKGVDSDHIYNKFLLEMYSESGITDGQKYIEFIPKRDGVMPLTPINDVFEWNVVSYDSPFIASSIVAYSDSAVFSVPAFNVSPSKLYKFELKMDYSPISTVYTTPDENGIFHLTFRDDNGDIIPLNLSDDYSQVSIYLYDHDEENEYNEASFVSVYPSLLEHSERYDDAPVFKPVADNGNKYFSNTITGINSGDNVKIVLHDFYENDFEPEYTIALTKGNTSNGVTTYTIPDADFARIDNNKIYLCTVYNDGVPSTIFNQIKFSSYNAGSPSYTISSASCQNGTISLSKTSAKAGEFVTVIPKADERYELVPGSLKVNGEQIYNYSFEVKENSVVSALFRETFVERYTVTILPSTGGSATVDKQYYEAGETVTMTITPKPYHEFLYIDSIGAYYIDYSQDGNTITFTMPAVNVVIELEFEAQTFGVFTDWNNYYTCEFENGMYFAYDEQVELIIKPVSGCQNPITRIYYLPCNESDGTTKTDITNNSFKMPPYDITIYIECEVPSLNLNNFWCTESLSSGDITISSAISGSWDNSQNTKEGIALFTVFDDRGNLITSKKVTFEEDSYVSASVNGWNIGSAQNYTNGNYYLQVYVLGTGENLLKPFTYGHKLPLEIPQN